MIRIAGAGPGDVSHLTIAVYEAIKSTQKVIAFGRVGHSLKEIRPDITMVTKVNDLLDHINPEEDILILASGDPLFFGITDFLKRQNVEIDEVMPGLSSFQYFMAKLQKSWQTAHLFSFHGRDYRPEELLQYDLSVGLVDRKHPPSMISKDLYDLGARGKIYVGSYLSHPEETLEELFIGEASREEHGLSIVVIEIEMD